MPLKLEHLLLNDTDRKSIFAAEDSVTPDEKEVCDDVVLLWKQEPSSEELDISKLYAKIKARNQQWALPEERFKTILANHNLYSTDSSQLFTYADQVTSLETPDLPDKVLKKVEVRYGSRGKSLYAKVHLKQGELIFSEHDPLTPIPPLDKTALAEKGRSCSLCGLSLTQSSHFTIMNGLDCQNCSAVWCSKSCKKIDTTHPYLKHPMSKNKKIDGGGWLKFEAFCKEQVITSAYSVGLIYARVLVERGDGQRIWSRFKSLAQVSQKLRIKAADSSNIGGTFDASNGSPLVESRSTWERCFDLFCGAFPIAESEGIDLDTFLTYIGKFNINQLSGQLYTIYSHLNHNCEPNVRYEIDSKMGLKVFARKSIDAGQELLTTYVNPLHGVMLRRRELRVNWGFLCDCNRCINDLEKRKVSGPSVHLTIPSSCVNTQRRKSSLKAARPDLSELLKNGQEFDLEIPNNIGVTSRRKSVRFDDKVMAAVEE